MADRFDEVRRKLLQFRDQRDWARYQSSELLENLLWKTVAESRQLNGAEIQAIGQEISDIFIYLIYLCEELDLDLMEEATKKLKLNEKRFPIKIERSAED